MGRRGGRGRGRGGGRGRGRPRKIIPAIENTGLEESINADPVGLDGTLDLSVPTQAVEGSKTENLVSIEFDAEARRDGEEDTHASVQSSGKLEQGTVESKQVAVKNPGKRRKVKKAASVDDHATDGIIGAFIGLSFNSDETSPDSSSPSESKPAHNVTASIEGDALARGVREEPLQDQIRNVKPDGQEPVPITPNATSDGPGPAPVNQNATSDGPEPVPVNENVTSDGPGPAPVTQNVTSDDPEPVPVTQNVTLNGPEPVPVTRNVIQGSPEPPSSAQVHQDSIPVDHEVKEVPTVSEGELRAATIQQVAAQVVLKGLAKVRGSPGISSKTHILNVCQDEQSATYDHAQGNTPTELISCSAVIKAEDDESGSIRTAGRTRGGNRGRRSEPGPRVRFSQRIKERVSDGGKRPRYDSPPPPKRTKTKEVHPTTTAKLASPTTIESVAPPITMGHSASETAMEILPQPTAMGMSAYITPLPAGPAPVTRTPRRKRKSNVDPGPTPPRRPVGRPRGSKKRKEEEQPKESLDLDSPLAAVKSEPVDVDTPQPSLTLLKIKDEPTDGHGVDPFGSEENFDFPGSPFPKLPLPTKFEVEPIAGPSGIQTSFAPKKTRFASQKLKNTLKENGRIAMEKGPATPVASSTCTDLVLHSSTKKTDADYQNTVAIRKPLGGTVKSCLMGYHLLSDHVMKADRRLSAVQADNAALLKCVVAGNALQRDLLLENQQLKSANATQEALAERERARAEEACRVADEAKIYAAVAQAGIQQRDFQNSGFEEAVQNIQVEADARVKSLEKEIIRLGSDIRKLNRQREDQAERSKEVEENVGEIKSLFGTVTNTLIKISNHNPELSGVLVRMLGEELYVEVINSGKEDVTDRLYEIIAGCSEVPAGDESLLQSGMEDQSLVQQDHLSQSDSSALVAEFDLGQLESFQGPGSLLIQQGDIDDADAASQDMQLHSFSESQADLLGDVDMGGLGLSSFEGSVQVFNTIDLQFASSLTN